MDKERYRLLVKTDCWKIRREDYLGKFGWRCEICVSRIPQHIQVHHLNYDRLGQERDDDLLAVCERCHQMLHGIPQGTDVMFALQLLAGQVFTPKRESVIGFILKARREAVDISAMDREVLERFLYLEQKHPEWFETEEKYKTKGAT
jgi:hypothetical protein